MMSDALSDKTRPPGCFRRQPFKVRLEFKLADLWVGVFWKRTPAWHRYSWDRTDVWVCLLPCLPIHFTWSSWPLVQSALACTLPSVVGEGEAQAPALDVDDTLPSSRDRSIRSSPSPTLPSPGGEG